MVEVFTDSVALNEETSSGEAGDGKPILGDFDDKGLSYTRGPGHSQHRARGREFIGKTELDHQGKIVTTLPHDQTLAAAWAVSRRAVAFSWSWMSSDSGLTSFRGSAFRRSI